LGEAMNKMEKDKSIAINQKLLNINMCNKYDWKKCKERLTNIVNQYKEYLCEELDLSLPTITPSYQIRYSQQPKNNNTDKVGDYVTRKLDLEQKANELFNEISNMVETRLSPDERIYFIESFLNDSSENQICEILRIYPTSLARIKISAIIKASLYFLVAVPVDKK